MDLTVTWRGTRYIDFTRAWPDHAAERARTIPVDKKGKPGVLHRLKIPMAATIVTKKNDFRSSANILTRGGQKSYWITTQTWRDKVAPLPEGVPDPDHEVIGDPANGPDQTQAQDTGAESQDTPSLTNGVAQGTDRSAPPAGGVSMGTNRSPTPIGELGESTQTSPETMVLEPIEMDEDEHFVFHGQVVRIRAYGERLPDSLYLDAGDAKCALGIRPDHPLPNDIDITDAVLPNGDRIRVLSYREQMALMSLYRKQSEVALHVVTWVNRLAFAAQYGRAEVREQIADAVDAQFRIVQGDRTDAQFASRVGYYNYMIEVCSLPKLLDLFPDANGILDRISPDAEAPDYTVVKYGTGKVDRPQNVVKDLRRIFPGCDPVIVRAVRFPGATEQDAIDRETEWKVAFHEVNIKGVTNRRSAYTELFAMNAESAKRGIRKMDEMLENHNEERERSMLDNKTELDEANLRAREAEFKTGLLEKTVAEMTTRNQKLEADVKAYKTTLKKTMPRSLASKLDAILN